MMGSLSRMGLFALYQFALLVGIALMPVALLASRAGVRLPVGRLVESLGEAYESTAR